MKEETAEPKRTNPINPDHERILRCVDVRCRGARSPFGDALVSDLLKRGMLEEARVADRENRTSCGHDTVLLVMQYPLDGVTRTHPCPQCGLMLTWTPAALEHGSVS